METLGTAHADRTRGRDGGPLDRGTLHGARIPGGKIPGDVHAMSELDRIGREVCTIARRAGAAILEIYAGTFSVEHKADNSPLTAADMAAHHAIVEGLRALTPDIPVLSEESAGIPWDVRATWTRYWPG